MSTLLRHPMPRAGFSYVELCLAILILSLCLIPAAQMLPSLLAGQRDLETHYQLNLAAREKLDTATLDLEGNFAARDVSGDFAAQGHPAWRYHLVVSVPPAGNGRYAVLRIDVWADEDGDQALDPQEPHVRYDTLHANRKWSL